MGLGLKHKLGASHQLGAKIYGAKVPAKSPPCLRRAQDLGAKIYGAETSKLGATNDDAELRVQILKVYLQKHICEKLLKKGLKNKKVGHNCKPAE